MRALFGAGAFRRKRGPAPGGGPGFDFSDLFARARRRGGPVPGGGDRRFGGAGFSDLFSSIFSGGGGRAGAAGPGRGRDVETEVVLNFADAVRAPRCRSRCARRAPARPATATARPPAPRRGPAPTAGAQGVVTSNQGSFSFTEPCRECQGVGTIVDEKCPECEGTRRRHQDPHDQRAHPSGGRRRAADPADRPW